MTAWEDYLSRIYYNPKHPASFEGPQKLYHVVKKDGKYDLSLHTIRKWLSRQEPYSLQRPLRRTFQRNRVVVSGIDDQWEMDLMDMTKYKQDNEDTSFVLVVIDVFSKFLWLRGLQNKQGSNVANALQNILKDGRQPVRIRSDKGQEFNAKVVRKLLNDKGIHHFVSQNETKANIAERVIKTIKSKIVRYFTHTQRYKYIHHLQDFAHSYNATEHSTIGVAPNQVTTEKETSIWWKIYWPSKIKVKSQNSRRPYTFIIGNLVRISHLRNVFSREYDERWTGELFKISGRRMRGGIPVYTLNDFQDDPIKGSFYQSELQKVDKKETDGWKIEKVLKKRGRGEKKQLYVKWLHYPTKFNSWVEERDLI